jgi:tyrosine-protein kinase Etk/Wzc
MTSDTLISELKEDETPVSLTPTVGAPKQSEDVSLLDMLVVVAARKRLVFGVMATCTAISLIVSLLLPVRYTAKVILLPPQQNTSIGNVLASQLGSIGGVAALASGGLGLKNQNEMYVGMLRSSAVEDAVIQKFGLMQEYHKKYLSEARRVLENRTEIDGSGKDGLIHISFEDHDPTRAAALANGYVDQFRSLSQGLAITEASQRRLFFQRELEQAKNNLADAEEALKRTEETTGVIQLDSQARALIQSAASLRAQITEREVEIQGMESYATGENSQLLQAQRELQSLREQLAKLGGSEDSATELMVPKGRVPEAGLEYVRKLRDVKYYETIFEIIARQFEVAKLDEAKEGQIIQVVDPAIVPDRKSFPKRGLIVIAAAFLGLLFGILIALAQAGLDRIQRDPEAHRKMEFVWRSFRLKRSNAS